MAYDRQTASALRMLQRYGVPLTMTRGAGVVVRDVVSQTSVTNTPITQTIQAAILPVTESRDLTNDEPAAVRVERRTLYISGRDPSGAALTIEPMDNDSVVFEGSSWSLKTRSRIAPDGGSPVLFIAEARR